MLLTDSKVKLVLIRRIASVKTEFANSIYSVATR